MVIYARAAERLGVAQAVVGLVRLGERRVFAVAPVEVAAVDDGAADLNGVAVDVLRRRMDDDVGAPFNRAAEDRRGERVVDDQRHAVGMRDARELFNVADRERGVGQRFGENGSRVGLEGFLQRLLVGVLVDEDALDAHALQSSPRTG